ncbi:MAG: cupin domain-containing protein [Bacteroidia bacterium]|nr:cupin domain-containing protein [Bacteroidia bacterium]
MRQIFLLLLLSVAVLPAFSQNHPALHKLRPGQGLINIKVVPLESDPHASSFLIWIRKSVKLHKHDSHSEHVLILRGKGLMRLGDREFMVRKGDLIFIPQGTPHSVKVKGRTMAVLSIQAPQFFGKDRIMIE